MLVVFWVELDVILVDGLRVVGYVDDNVVGCCNIIIVHAISLRFWLDDDGQTYFLLGNIMREFRSLQIFFIQGIIYEDKRAKRFEAGQD